MLEAYEAIELTLVFPGRETRLSRLACQVSDNSL